MAAPPSPIRSSGVPSSLSRVHQSGAIQAASRATSSPLDSPFKLQPRHSRCIPPAGSSRGRKRGAGSISSTIFSDSTCHGYLNEKQAGEQDTVSTTLLEEDMITPPMTFFHPSSTGTTPSDGVDHAAASLHALTITTPRSMNCSASSFVASQVHLQGRSSFSKYAGSPAGSLRSASNSPSASIGNVSKASPGAKIAPLRVLSSNDSGTTPVRKFSTNRSIGEATDAIHLKPPPLVVHCTNSDTGVDTSFLEEDEEDYSVGNAPPSSAVEASSRRSVASMSERTPLPKVSLTPRSHVSRTSQLPRFPSPEGDDVDSDFVLHTPGHSHAFSMTPPRSARTSQDVCFDSFGFFVDNNIQDGPQDRSLEESSAGAPLENLEDDGPGRQHKAESFIPLPDWVGGFPSLPRIMHPGSLANNDDMNVMFNSGQESTNDPNATGGLVGTMRRNSHELLQPTLDPSQDIGSLSASDDEDAFFLVPPSKLADRDEGKHRSKQRRLQCSFEAEKRRFSFSSSVGHASNASLLGMGFVPSTTSLHGLCSSNSLRGQDASATLGIQKREESSGSIGLALDQAPNPDEGRALMTPPVMPEAKSPPPLSPRPGVFRNSTDGDSSL